MQLPENPIMRTLSILFAIIFGVVALGWVGVFGLLIAVSTKDPSRREMIAVSGEPDARYWARTTDICLRNRTAAPLQVRVVAARAAVQFDSIWWPLPLIPDAIGRAVMLRDSFTVRGLHYRPAGRTLVLGTVDTLIDVHYPSPLPRALAHCRRIDIRYSTELATNKFKSGDPNFERVIRVQRLPAQPNSLHLTLYLEPGDTLALGHRRVKYFASGLPPAATALENEVPPVISVRWQDAQHHLHRHRPRLAGWLQVPTPAAPPTGRQQVRHYLDYPLNYATIIAR